QKPRRDRGTTRGRHSTSSSTFNQPSSSHLNDDDDDDGNNEGTSRASTPSLIWEIVDIVKKTLEFDARGVEELVDIVKSQVGYSGSGVRRRGAL
nr:hypothetical protein [Tanacetum cinerariifolium]